MCIRSGKRMQNVIQSINLQQLPDIVFKLNEDNCDVMTQIIQKLITLKQSSYPNVTVCERLVSTQLEGRS